jgi:hypothetical protein
VRDVGNDLLASLVKDEVVARSLRAKLMQTSFRDFHVVLSFNPNETAVYIPPQDIEWGDGHMSLSLK